MRRRNRVGRQASIDVEGLKARLLERAGDLVARWLPAGRSQGRYVKFGGVDGEAGNSAWVHLDTGAWRDEATTDGGGDLISLYAALRCGGDNARALLDLAREFGMAPDPARGSGPSAPGAGTASPAPAPPQPPVPAPAVGSMATKLKWVPLHPVPDDAPPYRSQWGHYAHGIPARHWEYRDAQGRLLGVVCRFEASDGTKDVQPLSYCQGSHGVRAWRYRAFVEPRPLYGLDRLPVLDEADPPVVLVVEGEKCADALYEALERRFAVVAWPGGGKAVGKVDWSPLRGFRLTCWPDADAQVDKRTGRLYELADQPGVRAMKAVARSCESLGCEVRVVDVGQPGDRPSGWDCADAIAEGWSGYQLQAFLGLRAPPAGRPSSTSGSAADGSGYRSGPPRLSTPTAAASAPSADGQASPPPGDTPPAAGPASSLPPAPPAGGPPAPRKGRGKATAPGDADDGASGPPDPAPRLFDRFTVTDEGVFYTESSQDGRPGTPIWVCSKLVVIARTRDADGGDWGYLIEFDDPTGTVRVWAMPARMLAGDGAEFRSVLLSMGLRIASGTKARNLLTQYLQSRQPAEVAQCTDRIGWHDGAFVLPRQTLQRTAAADEAPPPERIVYQTDGTAENQFRVRGSLVSWQTYVAALCVGNTRLAFAVSCAFAGPLMRLAGFEGGGFHLRGNSSCGKTTAQRVAVSVYGGPSFMQSWRATDNALEAVAAQYCDVLLVLDELAAVESRTAGDIAYMLSAGIGKLRSTRSGQTRKPLKWVVLFISSGEIGLPMHMAEGGKRARAGQEIRMVDLPAEVAPGTIFDTLHDHRGGDAFADHLKHQVRAHHGHAGRAWLQWCVDHADELRDRTRAIVETLVGRWVPNAASGQVHRAGRRFALVAAAGELATEAGITGWPAGEATAAADACFHAWLSQRQGGIGNSEEAQMLAQVRRWLQLNGAGRFTYWHRALDDRAPDKGLRAGFRRILTEDGRPINRQADHQREYGETMHEADGEKTLVEHYVFPEVFESEVCDGFDHRAVLRVLRSAGHLVVDKDGERTGRFAVKVRLPGIGPARCYRFNPSILAGTDE